MSRKPEENPKKLEILIDLDQGTGSGPWRVANDIPARSGESGKRTGIQLK